MTVLVVFIVESVLVDFKIHILTPWIVDCGYSSIADFIGNSELSLETIQRQNVSDVLFIKPYLAISLYIGFSGSLNGSTILF